MVGMDDAGWLGVEAPMFDTIQSERMAIGMLACSAVQWTGSKGKGPLYKGPIAGHLAWYMVPWWLGVTLARLPDA